jgi:hypothetical protein
MTPIRIRLFSSLCLLVLCCANRAVAQSATPVAGVDTNAVKAEMDTAIHQVEKIVNQTVPASPRAGDALE